jgi:hypothetical protein
MSTFQEAHEAITECLELISQATNNLDLEMVREYYKTLGTIPASTALQNEAITALIHNTTLNRMYLNVELVPSDHYELEDESEPVTAATFLSAYSDTLLSTIQFLNNAGIFNAEKHSALTEMCHNLLSCGMFTYAGFTMIPPDQRIGGMHQELILLLQISEYLEQQYAVN